MLTGKKLLTMKGQSFIIALLFPPFDLYPFIVMRDYFFGGINAYY